MNMASAPTAVGLIAAFCTTVSYIPQLRKCWKTGKTDDLSLKMFSILGLGILLWVVYGVLQRDAIIVFADSISLCLLTAILFFKLRERLDRSDTAGCGTRRQGS
jgi:MtN3 and saliva related transmembrane protein